MGIRTAKMRRTGNSNAISLSTEYEALGFTPGSRVVIVPDGEELRLVPGHRAHTLMSPPPPAAPGEPGGAPGPAAGGGDA